MDTAHATAPADRMSGEDYMQLLLERQRVHISAHPGKPAPLLEWLIQPGDEHLFTPPKVRAQPKRPAQPRTYLPSSYWRGLREKAQAELDALNHGDMPELAAATGEGIGARRASRYHQRLDQRVRRGAALTRKIESLDRKVRRAEHREGVKQ